MGAAACGGSGDDNVEVVREADAPFVPVIESSDLAVGEGRIVLHLLDRDRPPQFAAGTRFRLRVFEPTSGGVRFREDVPLAPLAVDPDIFYVALEVPLDQPGTWQLAVIAEAGSGSEQTSPRLPFDVAARSRAPAIGDAAPASRSLTLSDSPLELITSDPEPDAELYRRSIHEALAEQEPFVVVFTTVGYCFGRSTCARAVEQLKRLAPGSGVRAIHVEPLSVEEDGAPLPRQLEVLEEWALKSDPWIFVVDSRGRIVARFELVASDKELSTSLRAAAGR